MSTANPPSQPLDPLQRRAALRLLALPFRYPVAEALDAYRNGEFLDALREQAAAIPHLAAALDRHAERLEAARRALEGMSVTELEVAFTGTFVAGMPEPPCPPYEGLVRQAHSRVQILLEVSDFYRHFGLKMDPGERKNELPDHLCAEIEFLQFLCLKEAQAREEGQTDLCRGYVLAQRDFLARHLVEWTRPFAERLAAHSQHLWFSAVAALLADYLDGERALLEGYLAELKAVEPAVAAQANDATPPPT
ncbi:MAG TPA: molecular chaperone TorD family protein [Anaeromyxobacteraceae bacterium]|nr:molecular chaperone TorD family protein [Anaeromyxobacteraceae bacterium]